MTNKIYRSSTGIPSEERALLEQTYVVMSFKTIYENTFTIMVIERNTNKVLYKH